MIGTDVYYLFSPFNIILFLFPQNWLPIAIMIEISLKVGTIGLAGYTYWRCFFDQKHQAFALSAAIAYALSGYVIAYNLNLMWLDSLICLPFWCASLDRMMLGERQTHLLFWTVMLWLTNFYTGYMALLYGSGVFIIKLSHKSKKLWRAFLKRYLKTMLTALFICAFALLPTILELTQGKTASTSLWNNLNLNWQYPLDELLGKLISGSYSFHEMQAGSANLFLTTPLLLSGFLFWFQPQIPRREKIGHAILVVFLILSTSFNPFVLLWHMGQYPIWYPARFSYVLIFEWLTLAIRGLACMTIPSLLQKEIIALFGLILITYASWNPRQIAYLTDSKRLTTAAFICLTILFLWRYVPTKTIFSGFFLLIVFLSATINLSSSLNAITYQKNKDYTNFAQNVKQTTSYLQKRQKSLHRTETDFRRSDNDPMTGNYYGLSHFNSLTEAKVIQLMDRLGYVNNTNSFENQFPTLLSDSLLGVSDMLIARTQGRVSTNQKLTFNSIFFRSDLATYPTSKQFKQLAIEKNPTALPLVFISPTQQASVSWHYSAPAQNQEAMLNNILGKKLKLFHNVVWPDAHLQNTTGWPGSWLQYNRKKMTKPSKVSFDFVPSTNDAYYLDLPGNIEQKQASLSVNNALIDTSNLSGDDKLINLANHQKGQTIKITFVIYEKSLNLNAASIVRLNTTALTKQLKRLKQHQPITRQVTPLKLMTSDFNLTHDQSIKTTIPYDPNWLIFDKGHLVSTQQWGNVFLMAKLPAGKHRLTMIYVPWSFLLGCLISLSVLISSRKSR